MKHKRKVAGIIIPRPLKWANPSPDKRSLYVQDSSDEGLRSFAISVSASSHYPLSCLPQTQAGCIDVEFEEVAND